MEGDKGKPLQPQGQNLSQCKEKGDIEQLWLPYMIYTNTDMMEAVQLEVGVVDTTIVVTKEGNFVRSDNEVQDETEIFEGNSNTLSMCQTYTKSFQCLYKLQKHNLIHRWELIRISCVSHFFVHPPALTRRNDEKDVGALNY